MSATVRDDDIRAAALRAERGGLEPQLRRSATMLLLGQLLFIVATQFHTGGDANDHHTVFGEYAGSGIWTAVHIAQFAGMAILLAGLLALFFAVDIRPGAAGRFGPGAAVAALALYGGLQAVDGIALKRAVSAWVSAPAAEEAARFASAETIRWLEWGVRSYHDFALGLALVAVAVAVVRSALLPKLMAYLMGLSGVAYLVQGGVLSTEGFSTTHTILILVTWVVSLAWMVWLAMVAGRRSSESASSAQGSERKLR